MFDVLKELDDEDYISQGAHPSRSKSVYITESGIEKAKELLEKYGLGD
jgi:DNA-binding PadR family transcriptional regulator